MPRGRASRTQADPGTAAGVGTPPRLSRRSSPLQDLQPWSGFAAAADGALEVLHGHVGLDLWMVLQRRGDQQVVVAVRGDWITVPTGAVFPWAESFCRHMVAGKAPRIAPRCQDIPAYAAAAAGRKVQAHAYVGIPIVDGDGQLFGTVCGFAAEPRDDGLYAHRPLLETVTRLLSTLLAKEQAAAERSQAAADAYARIDRDPVTGVLNWRGWHRALVLEQDRQQRYSGNVSLVAVERVGAEWSEPDVLGRAAQIITGCCRASDTVARGTDRLFAVLAPHCPAEQAVSLAHRLADRLAAAGLTSRINYLTCPAGNDLVAAWADGALSDPVNTSPSPSDAERSPGFDLPALRPSAELIRGSDDAGFRRTFLPLRDGCLWALHAAGLDYSQLSGLVLTSVQFARAGVLVVLPGRGGIPGGRILLPYVTGGSEPGSGPVASVRAYHRALLSRLITMPQHPVAPPPTRWPLFPLISPAGKLTPVGLSARHLGRLLYGRTDS